MKYSYFFLFIGSLFLASCCGPNCPCNTSEEEPSTSETDVTGDNCYAKGYVALLADQSDKTGIIALDGSGNKGLVYHVDDINATAALHDDVYFKIVELGGIARAKSIVVLDSNNPPTFCSDIVSDGFMNLHNMYSQAADSDHRIGHMMLTGQKAYLNAYGGKEFNLAQFVESNGNTSNVYLPNLENTTHTFYYKLTNTDYSGSASDGSPIGSYKVVKSTSPCHFHCFDRGESCM